MRHRISTILTLIAVVSFSLLLAGQAAAASYQRYVLFGPNGGKIFVFTTPERPGLDLLLKDIFDNRFLLPFLRIPRPFPWHLEPEPEPIPTPQPAPSLEPKPVPLPKPQPAPAPEPVPEPSANPDQPVLLTAEEKLMVDLVNKEREKIGLKPLSVDMRLVELARKKSQDMIDNGYFSHYSPTYGTPFDMMEKAGIKYRTAGENLAGAPTVEQAHRALMESDGHRKNILNPAFTHIGVGVIKGGAYGMMFTQMFIGS